MTCRRHRKSSSTMSWRRSPHPSPTIRPRISTRVKGNTWSGTFWSLELSDPLAALDQAAAGLTLYWPFLLTALVPIALTVVFGRIFCGWICPATLLFDLLAARSGFCRYLCPGGALYSLLGRYRPLRIRRIVENCNDCAKSNAVCEFDLDPLARQLRAGVQQLHGLHRDLSHGSHDLRHPADRLSGAGAGTSGPAVPARAGQRARSGCSE